MYLLSYTLCVLVFLNYSNAIPFNLLYDYDVPDAVELPTGNDKSSREIQLRTPIVFFGLPFDTIFVNSNGLLSFQTEIQQFLNIEFPLDYPIIAPLYSHVDTTRHGKISYYETSSPGLLERATSNVHDSFSEARDFQATSLFIVTWNSVGYYKQGDDKLNTFQVAIASDGQSSFVEFLYPENGIQWIQGVGDESGLPDARSQAGIISPDGKVFTLPGSGSEQVKHLESWTNMDLAGQFIFKIDGPTVEQPDINNKNIKYNGPALTCAEALTVCHVHAQCKDYKDGLCCNCKEKYYGNGKYCIKKDQPLRINGKVNGKINGEDLDNLDLQSYVVMSDGRAYTAISKIPQSIGFDFQSLQILGGVIGYLFAKPLRGAVNGYHLTGGIFNHSATVIFLNTSQTVYIKQKYFGLDVFDQLRLEADIRGEIPKLPNDVRINIDEYEEEYSLTTPGLLQMSSNRNFKYINALNNEEIVYYYNIKQSIKFDYCKYDNRSIGEIWRLKVGKNFISYEAREQIIRYGLSNKIVPFGDADPCDDGRSKCGPNSSCVIESESYRCVCNPGYQEFYRDNETLCADIDECLTGHHDCDYNALCENVVGGFLCKCKPGFEGNGQICESASSCATVVCPENAECQESNEVAQCVCQKGFIGDGQRCDPVINHSCHVSNNCSPYGMCAINPSTNDYYCTCLPNFEGNGYDCRPIPGSENSTSTSTAPVHREIQRCLLGVCWCPEGYKLEKDSKYCLSPEEEKQKEDSGNNKTARTDSDSCDIFNNCHKEATCVFSESVQSYICQCNDGFDGDGYTSCDAEENSCSVLDNCHENAICTYDDLKGKSICVCNPGYEGTGLNCNVIGRCSSNSECTSTEVCKLSSISQQYECECKENHHRDSQHQCVPTEKLCGGGLCVENAECLYEQELQTFYCSCKSGFRGDGITECNQKPVGCDVANNCDQHATCSYNDQTTIYECQCNPGFEGNGLTCYSEKTCQIDPNMCHPDAICTLEEKNKYTCKCKFGFVGNGTICKPPPDHEGNFLLLNYGMATIKVPIDPNSPKSLGKHIQMNFNQVSVGLDIDCLHGRFYWSDISGRSIKSSNFNGSEKEDFITTALGSPEGIAIDWVSRNIYWTDSTNDTIEVANLDSKRRRTLFDTNLVNPRGIAVHPKRGKIFWSDWNRRNPKIEWANADGSEREIFLQGADVSLPNSLTIDYQSDSLCYTDAGTKKIECVQIDSKIKQTMVINTTYPFGIAVTEKYIYWSDWISKKIEVVEKYTLTRKPAITVPISGSGGKLYGLVSVPKKCPLLSNACQYYKCPEEYLCLPKGSNNRSCVCSYRSDNLGEMHHCTL